MDQGTSTTAAEPATSNPPAPTLTERVRQRWENLTTPKHVLTFEELYQEETRQLSRSMPAGSDGAKVGELQVRSGSAGEPAVCFTPHDRFGLALSGGGIRSATFNLGLLQSLARLGILKHVDYLATVSGGGYVGGFWTAWLHRRGKRTGPERFPLGSDRRSGERAEIRHLREFSRFLLPRVGILQTEFWAIVMTVLGGMLPSLLAALAVLGTAWYLWVIGLVTLTLPGWAGQSVNAFALLLYLAATEIKWRNAGRAEQNARETWTYAVAGVASALFVFLQVRNVVAGPNLFAWSSFSTAENALAIPTVLTVCALGLLVLRVLAARVLSGDASISAVTGLERCAIRMVALTAGMFGLAGLWLVSGWLGKASSDFELKLTAGGTALSAALFAWAKKWLTQPVQESRGGTFVEFAVERLKRATPKVLAMLVWLLLFVIVGALVHRWGDRTGHVMEPKFWLPFIAGLGIIAVVALIFDPARVGMHDFYRSRLARCYLGAANFVVRGPEAERVAQNRQVAERPGDDLKLGQLREIDRPIHLVCVAANDMSGDPLGNLYRGARSAVLSGNGISLGNETARLDDLRFSSAMTASAAAFNSQMGRVSMDLGPAVGFLMSALNLRLGLWVPHPRNRFRGKYLFPGRFFLAELLGFSRADGHNLHLSDGNHFENFGLYELVRRHCRYIIVSDCGADPEVAFDDLANVLRRVREDFGVEIELDIAPLRPDENNRSRQHAVVGTVHYNGVTGMDKGTILYFKSGLTGDETPDVLQYSTRNREFPHEGTGDQFYDEAQWESYRRLGEHAADAVLGFFESSRAADVNVPDRLFRDARSRWHPAPEDQNVNFLEMSERCANLEHDLMSGGPERLRAEFFAEATALAALRPKPVPEKKAESVPAVSEAEIDIQVLGYLMRVAQIMEDLWVAADLDRYWSHPLNEGWMNYFRRWAATPSFRRWWPVIASFYGIGLRAFVGERFHVGASDPASPRHDAANGARAQLHFREVTDSAKFMQESFAARQYGQGRPAPVLSGRRVFAYDLELLGYNGQLSEEKLPVGLIIVREELVDAAKPDVGWAVIWDVDDLFVPDCLYGAGFVSKLLDAVLRFYRTPPVDAGRVYSEARVEFAGVGGAANRSARTAPRGRAARYECVREIEFYKSRGFSYVRAEDPRTGAISLRVML